MTEKDKMLHGEWHDANFDDVLLRERRNAELLCYDFIQAFFVFRQKYSHAFAPFLIIRIRIHLKN